jgi:Tol biopolymer transport system component
MLVDLQTGERRPLAGPRDFYEMSAPRFDPTSSTVLFSAATAGSLSQAPHAQLGLLASWLGAGVALAHGFPQDLWTVALDGSDPKQLVALQADEPTTSWSPDGRQIAVLSSEALAVGMVGARPTPLLTPGAAGSVDWAS